MEKVLYQKKLHYLLTWSKNLSVFVEISLTGLTKPHCRWPQEHFEHWKFFEKSNKLFIILPHWSTSCRLSGLSKLHATCLSFQHFWTVSGNFTDFCWFFRRNWQNCTLCIQWNFLRQIENCARFRIFHLFR